MNDEPPAHNPDCPDPPPVVKLTKTYDQQTQLLQIMVPVTTLMQLSGEAADLGCAHLPADYIRAKLARPVRARLHYTLEAAQNPSLN